MSRERDIFLEALEIPDVRDRADWIAEACAGDAELLDRVRALLTAHDAGPGFLDASPAAASAPASREDIGSIVDRYRLLEKIGEGGFGVVYMAEQREPVRRKVALKIIKLGMDTRQVVARFEAERQALALMDHPNIAKVLDAGATETGRPYFVMELVRGTPITRFCDDTEATPEERLHLFVEVCSAIQHAHQKGIIHRDIKPNNVLVTMHDDRPVPKVIDFGIAKATQQELTDKTIFTRYHEFLGTPAYMSPEQTQLSGLDIDTRTDVYSLGVLLYELLTGRTPFDTAELLSGDYEDLRRRLRDCEPLKPSTRLNTLSLPDREAAARRRRSDPKRLSRLLRGDLDWIVMKALEKDRTRRYESASAFAQDVQRYLRDQPVVAVAPSFRYRLRKFARRHRTALPAAALVVTLLVLSAVVSVHLAWRAQRDAATAGAVLQFLNDEILGMADPDNHTQPDISLRAVLDRALLNIPPGLSNQPAALATIHTTVGRAYGNLSLHEPAIRHLRGAHAVLQQAFGEAHEKTIRARLDLAYAVDQAGMPAEALPEAERARDLAQKHLGPNHRLTVLCKSRLAANFYRLRRRTEAFELAREAWNTARTVCQAPEIDAYPALSLVAREHGRSNDFEEGERLHRRALAAFESRYGHRNIRTEKVRNELGAYLYDHRRHLDEARQLFASLLRDIRTRLPEDHDFVQTVRGNLALTCEVTGQVDQALQLWIDNLRARPNSNSAAKECERVLRNGVPRRLIAVGTGGDGGLPWQYPTDAPPDPDPANTERFAGSNPAAGLSRDRWAKVEVTLPSPLPDLLYALVRSPTEPRLLTARSSIGPWTAARRAGFHITRLEAGSPVGVVAGLNTLYLLATNDTQAALPTLEIFAVPADIR
ncbi:MAG: serine/threonine protein kinase [Verrucomicrobiales bacterium]|nr:serine/threonine protein kinase [Verrucomicrobiales bacterium]